MSEFTIVDVFAEERYAGNQLAVVERADGISGEEMQAIARAIGLEAGDLSHEFPARLASVGITFAMAPIASAEALERAALDLNVFRDEVVAKLGPTGIYAFRRGGRPGADVTSRMFFDASGVREDPATGSACVCLGGYALEHAYLGRGRDASSIEAVIEQGHAVGRPSVLRLRAGRDGDGDRVSVGGRTVMIARGTLVS